MTNLTEQLKKGELPVDKDYYIKLKNGLILIDYYCQLYDNCHFPNGIGFDSIPKNDIAEVLAPVPSYEEWQAKLDENAQLKEEVENCEFILKSRESEIVKLKELLKECKYELRGCYTDIGWEDQSLINKIDQVLGEDKC